jgi:hypothetical protein
MPERIETLRNIPTAEKARLEKDYKLVGATVTWKDQGNDLWTLTATFPDSTTGTAAAMAEKKPGTGG